MPITVNNRVPNLHRPAVKHPRAGSCLYTAANRFTVPAHIEHPGEWPPELREEAGCEQTDMERKWSDDQPTKDGHARADGRTYEHACMGLPKEA